MTTQTLSRPLVTLMPVTYIHHNNIQVIDDKARADEGVRRFYLNDSFGNRLKFLEWLSS
ncbi:hypothetical protein KCTCHS21_29750 [Cohnella abietis]|uniref:Uncharacterized protein n=1 Tax=Cohnella abietis TaxID=2507935 RepID=A0A3T1D670_9BACL|nr:hypothetical protein KCTCHS21_29750 [Cohnella abietis]